MAQIGVPPSQPPSQFAPVLGDEYAIADYIESVSAGHVDSEQITEYFAHCGAVLQYVPIGEIKQGNPDGNVPSTRKQKKYAKLPLETMPPIVIENGEVQDGNHRHRDALAKGAPGMWCYVVMERPELKQYLAAHPLPGTASSSKPKSSPSL